MNSTVFLPVPVLHVGVLQLAVMMTVTSWHHGIAAGGCSCESKCKTLAVVLWIHSTWVSQQ